MRGSSGDEGFERDEGASGDEGATGDEGAAGDEGRRGSAGGVARPLLKRGLGPAYEPVRRRWRAVVRERERVRARRLARRFVQANGLTVLGGPFAGLRYPDDCFGRVTGLVPKLIGCYERELSGAINEALEVPHRTIVNVGAADGYYAVGLALRSPSATVLAFEADAGERELCRELARENGVDDRVTVGGALDLGELPGLVDESGAMDESGAVDDTALVLCDCEGCELDLLRPELGPTLRRLRLIVELHDFVHPGTHAAFVERFSASHGLRVIRQEPRHPRDYPQLAGFPRADAEYMVSEHRPEAMEWAVLWPRA